VCKEIANMKKRRKRKEDKTMLMNHGDVFLRHHCALAAACDVITRHRSAKQAKTDDVGFLIDVSFWPAQVCCCSTASASSSFISFVLSLFFYLFCCQLVSSIDLS
jgi:hypothetical protein